MDKWPKAVPMAISLIMAMLGVVLTVGGAGQYINQMQYPLTGVYDPAIKLMGIGLITLILAICSSATWWWIAYRKDKE